MTAVMHRAVFLILTLCPLASRAQFNVVEHRKLSATRGGFISRLGDGDLFGTALARVGDLDGDGTADLAVGAPEDDDGGPDTGAVWILFLQRDGTVKAHQKISATEGGFGVAFGEGMRFGEALAAPGDLDGDGTPDLAVGVPRYGGGGINRGRVCILFLHPDGTVKGHTFVGDVGLPEPLVDGERFGYSVAAVGDLDGDGTPELVVGTPFDDDGGPDRGAVWLLFLRPDGTVRDSRKLSATAAGFAGRLDDGDGFGSLLAAVGDLDGDGTPDLAVGVPGADETVWLLFLTPDGSVRDVQPIPEENPLPLAFSGRALAALGDLDGDGAPDLAVSVFRGIGLAGTSIRLLSLRPDGTVGRVRKISATEGGFTGRLGTGDRFGSALAALGDLDGDGVVDLAAGAPRDDDGCPDADGDGRPDNCERGALWVLFLQRDGTVKAHQKISATEGGVFAGRLAENNAFGTAVAPLGDLDGDGGLDLAVGAPDGGAAAIWVLFLRPDGTIKRQQRIAEGDGGFVGSGEPEAFPGVALATVGDLDGDGLPELATGLFRTRLTGRGAFWILFLRADGTVKRQQRIGPGEGGFSGTLDLGDQFGSSLAALGDLDGDGTPDLAAGAYWDDDGGPDRGAVWILFLRPDGTVKRHQKVSATEGGFTGRLDNRDSFGFSLTRVGDLDGDGVPELAAGAPFDDDGRVDGGAVWILFLRADGTVKGHRKISATEGGFTDLLDINFGWAVGAPGDLDGDGLPDLLYGAPVIDVSTGSVGVMLLDADGTVRTDWRYSSTEGGFTGNLEFFDNFGWAVAAPGDLDGDGGVDLAVGAPGDDDGGTDQGAVWLLYLPPLPVVGTPEAAPVVTVGQQARVRVPVSIGRGTARATLSFRRAGENTFFSAEMTEDAPGLFSALIPADLFVDFDLQSLLVTPRGVDYFITARNDQGGEVRMPITGTRAIPVFVPGDGVEWALPGHEATADGYRLFSIPLALEAPDVLSVLADDLGPYSRKTWRFYAYEDGVLKEPGIVEVALAPGRAYWLLAPGAARRVTTGAGTTIPVDAPFPVPLTPGWNLIANPFNYPLRVANLRLSSGQPLDLLAYDRGFVPIDSLIRPFSGYALYNTLPGPDTLWFDPVIRPPEGAVLRPASPDAAPALRIRAYQGAFRDEDNRAVRRPDAAAGADAYDRPEPPLIGDYVSVAFAGPGGPLRVDARPEGPWEVVVRTARPGPVTLRFDGVPPGEAVRLVDDRAGVTVDLRAQDRYDLVSEGGGRARVLRLVVGPAGEGVPPPRYRLIPGFPNPFRAAVTLRYDLPAPGPVRLVVFDLLGRRVTTLVDAERPAGRHVVVWDGRGPAGAPVAAGVYVVRMHAGAFVASRTVTRLR